MGYWKNQFDKVARKAITTYADLYKTPAEQTGIMILMERVGEALTGGISFWTTINRKAKERVRFLHLYHGPKAKLDVTGMTIIIPKLIAKQLVRLIQQYELDPAVASLQVCLDRDDIYLFLMNGTRMVKLLGEEETFNDEQITIDQMQEAMA